MLYLVSYDIVIDKLRTKVAKTLEKAQLQRIQYSVFLGDINEVKLEQVKLKIAKIKGDVADFHVLFVPLHLPVLKTLDEIGETKIDWEYFQGKKDFLII